MNGYERLGASEYLVSDYVKVSELWRQYEDLGNDELLRRAAKLMCGTFGRLSGDQEFWGATMNAIRDAEHEREAVSRVLADLREFREIEEDVLTKFGIPPERASRLASDLITAIRMAERFPDGDTVANLQARVETLGAQICEVAAPHRVPGWRRRVAKGMWFLGGAAAIVVDGVTAPALPLTLLSIGGGVAMMAAEVIDE